MKLYIDQSHITTEYVPGLNLKGDNTMAPRKSKIETTLNKAAETALVPAKRPTRKATKTEPEKTLDWSPLGKVKEWRGSRQVMAVAQAAKQARAIERLRLEYLAYAASALFTGITLGVMLSSWLR